VAPAAHPPRLDRDGPRPRDGLAPARALPHLAPRQAFRAHRLAHAPIRGRPPARRGGRRAPAGRPRALRARHPCQPRLRGGLATAGDLGGRLVPRRGTPRAGRGRPPPGGRNASRDAGARERILLPQRPRSRHARPPPCRGTAHRLCRHRRASLRRRGGRLRGRSGGADDLRPRGAALALHRRPRGDGRRLGRQPAGAPRLQRQRDGVSARGRDPAARRGFRGRRGGPAMRGGRGGGGSAVAPRAVEQRALGGRGGAAPARPALSRARRRGLQSVVGRPALDGRLGRARGRGDP